MDWLSRSKQAMRSIYRSPAGNLRVPVAIGLGAIAGALSRYFLALLLNQWLGTAFPFATFLINLSGAFVMGCFTRMATLRNIISLDIRLIVAVGFLGSYTTFSAYTLDLERLLQTGQWQFASLYWLGSTILGVLSLELGDLLARRTQ